MAANPKDADRSKALKYRYKSRLEAEMEELLNNKDKKVLSMPHNKPLRT